MLLSFANGPTTLETEPNNEPAKAQPITVPGAFDGWVTLLEKYGTKKLSELLQPAIAYAESGFPVMEKCAEDWKEDDDVLQRHRHIFLDSAEQMVNAWRSVIGSQQHLAKWFIGPDGKPDEEYKARVKARFVQWVRDVCLRPRAADSVA